MAKVLIGLGSNLGNRKLNMEAAIRSIEKNVAPVLAYSTMHETAPEGFETAHRFLNAALEIETDLSPLQLLHILQIIETDLGRTYKSVDGIYCDRTIDIDLLDYEGYTMNLTELTLPHPRLHKRRFVLEPLNEIAPGWQHPLLHLTPGQMLELLDTTEQKD